MIYLDSSAIVKLARHETETAELRGWLAQHRRPLITSSLARTEAARVLRRSEPSALPRLAAVLAAFHQKPITDAILDAAAELPDSSLRSLEAIHLATVVQFKALSAFVAYDKRLLQVAQAMKLPAVSPGGAHE